MKMIICEMCGSHEFTEIYGKMECQYCGTTYYKEQTQKVYNDEPIYYNDYEEIYFDGIPSSLWETFGITLEGGGMKKSLKR